MRSTPAHPAPPPRPSALRRAGLPLLLIALLLFAPPAPATRANMPEPPPDAPLAIALNLNAILDTSHFHILRSSAFYNPRTANGSTIYNTEFPRHRIARLFGVFEWSAYESTDLATFKQKLHAHGPWVASLAGTHDAFVVMINFTPDWLSRSTDDTPMEGVWKVRNACRPADYAVWKQMVEETVRFMNQFGVKTYYEVWNEPDGAYWKEDIDAFLELYGQTATAVKAVAVNGLVGGTGVNQWDGRVYQSLDRGMVNAELIRYAKANNVPLDFVSWHLFGRKVSTLLDARAHYLAVAAAVGYTQPPELLVTEWNIDLGYRGTPYAAAVFASHMRMLYQCGIQHQLVAAWEDFNPKPATTDYGLITQRKKKKPVFYVHQIFDLAVRDGVGATAQLWPQRTETLLVKQADGTYELLIWNTESEAAITELRLTINGAASVAVLKAHSVMSVMAEKSRDARVEGNTVIIPFINFEFLRLRLSVDTTDADAAAMAPPAYD